jgi:hypothetical protein
MTTQLGSGPLLFSLPLENPASLFVCWSMPILLLSPLTFILALCPVLGPM